MHAAYGLPVFGVGQIHARADNIFEFRSGFFKSRLNQGKALASLCGRVSVVCADWRGAGNMHSIANAHGAGEADDRLMGEEPEMFWRIGGCSWREKEFIIADGCRHSEEWNGEEP